MVSESTGRVALWSAEKAAFYEGKVVVHIFPIHRTEHTHKHQGCDARKSQF